MAVITSGVIGAVVAVGSAVESKKQAGKQKSAAKKAAAGQAQSLIESAAVLQKAGRKGERAIANTARSAAQIASRIPGQAIKPISQIAQTGRQAFDLSAADILSGDPNSQSALSAGVAGANLGGFQGLGGEFSPAVSAELARQAGLSGEVAGRQSGQNLFGLGLQGVGVAGDIGRIKQRGFDRLSDIASQQAAGRTSVLVGSAVPTAGLIQGAGEARLLSDFASQRFDNQQSDILAGLAGQLLG